MFQPLIRSIDLLILHRGHKLRLVTTSNKFFNFWIFFSLDHHASLCFGAVTNEVNLKLNNLFKQHFFCSLNISQKKFNVAFLKCCFLCLKI